MSRFICNICGAANTNQGAVLHREHRHCQRCGSAARFRALVAALAYGLTGSLLRLAELKPNRRIRGFGCSDAEPYASRLGSRFTYTNTFLHTEPYVDITDRTTMRKFDHCDFIICSDVIEHTLEAPQVSLRNFYDTLGQNGILILAAPTFWMPATIERYPPLKSYQTVKFGDRYAVAYETQLGELGFDANPRFHGGDGQVLEVRNISHDQLVQELRAVGFESVETMSEGLEEFGATWPLNPELPDIPFTSDGRVLLARKPIRPYDPAENPI
jgi:hypothetical protein